ncbi:MAG TPA: hypothetical protein VGQ36_22020 [Thermoanaerobaculia bacterium]|nr:hypothetical protein [Thermoanaerobaculia bacterium]
MNPLRKHAYTQLPTEIRAPREQWRPRRQRGPIQIEPDRQDSSLVEDPFLIEQGAQLRLRPILEEIRTQNDHTEARLRQSFVHLAAEVIADANLLLVVPDLQPAVA